jgi:hypothetical protein
MSSIVVQFVANEFFPSLSFPPSKVTTLPSCCWYFNFSPIILISHILSWLFCKNFICFQFYHWILIYQILYFPIWSSFSGFLIFYFSLFIKVLLVFNFIIQFKLIVLCFSLLSSLFYFLNFSRSFCKNYYSFQFHSLITTLFLFLCQFWTPFFFSFFILLLNWFFFQFHHSIKYNIYFVFWFWSSFFQLSFFKSLCIFFFFKLIIQYMIN